jgi:putative transposase
VLKVVAWNGRSRCRKVHERHGRGPRGGRVIDDVPQGTWKTVTFVAALRHNQMVAPMVFDRPMTGQMFVTYVEQCLAPTPKRNDIVVIDNLRAHKVARCAR